MSADRLFQSLHELMHIPALSGHEERVRRQLQADLTALGLESRTDRLGNLIATIRGSQTAPSVMLFAHMDQLGFVVRKIEADGFLRLERVGGVPERALASQAVLICVGEGRDRPGVILNKSHHATGPEEKYQVVSYRDLVVDAGFETAAAARAAGIEIGTPVVYRPQAFRLGDHRVAGAAIDDRAGCTVVLEVARRLLASDTLPHAAARRATVHIVFSVQEEFNLRGVMPVVERLKPDIAIQIDLIMASDTPDMADFGEVKLGAGPAMSLYSFHGRGTLNGLIPHPALVRLFSDTAKAENIVLQRSAHGGALTETSYVQLSGKGVAAIDLGFPIRASHSSLEVCDLRDLQALADLLVAGLGRIDDNFNLERDGPI